jgi:thiamine kinase-like enzyme
MPRLKWSIHDTPLLTAWVVSVVAKHYSTERVDVVAVEQLGSIQPGRGIARIVVAVNKKRYMLYANQQPSAQQLYSILSTITPHFRSPLETVCPIAFNQASSILLYQEVAGTRVRDLIEKKRLSFSQIERLFVLAAKWFQRLHTITPPRSLPMRPMRFRVRDFSQTAAYKKLGPVISHINKQLQQLDTQRPAVIVHGDPHIANMITTKNNGLGVIDFSEARRGNPWYDIGMFFMHLELALHQYFSEQQIEKLQAVFLSSYLSRKKITPKQQTQLEYYKVRAALDFYKLTTAHHTRPAPYEQWMLHHLESVIFSKKS